MKVTTLRWAENIQTMNESEMVKKIMDSKSERRIKIERPEHNWMDEVLGNVINL